MRLTRGRRDVTSRNLHQVVCEIRRGLGAALIRAHARAGAAVTARPLTPGHAEAVAVVVRFLSATKLGNITLASCAADAANNQVPNVIISRVGVRLHAFEIRLR